MDYKIISPKRFKIIKIVETSICKTKCIVLEHIHHDIIGFIEECNVGGVPLLSSFCKAVIVNHDNVFNNAIKMLPSKVMNTIKENCIKYTLVILT